MIIAEAGVNHNGDMDMALRLVDAAAEAGADVVKFQTFIAEQLSTPDAPKAEYQMLGTDATESQLAMLQRLELDEAAHDALMARAVERGIGFLSTPFDLPSIALLRAKGIKIGKIPSGEVTNRPYLEAMARNFPDLVMSTGMCTLGEVEDAIRVLLGAGADKARIIVLHCNTQYPTPFADVNLRAMRTIAETFGTRVGYSDHTRGIEVPIAAAALGAQVIEKHITLDRGLPGPDHAASLIPEELKEMVRCVRHVEMALGDGVKRPSPSEAGNRVIARRSIHAARDIAAGTTIREDDLVMLRPGDGLSPMGMQKVVGRRSARAIPAGSKIQEKDLLT